VGCPALASGEDVVAVTDVCTGCGLCIEVCRRGALSYAGTR
jgi:ferredoxin